MDVVRSIGYVQLYFGIFLIISSLGLGFFSVGQFNNSREDYLNNNIEEQLSNISNATTVQVQILESQLVEFEVGIVLFKYQMYLTMAAIVIFLFVMGVHFTLSGIINTRLGEKEQVHSKKKLLINVGYAIIVGVIFAFLLAMLVIGIL